MRTVLYIQQIAIEVNSPGAEPIIRLEVVKVVKNGDRIIQIVPGHDEVFRKATDVAFQTVDFQDPVTQSTHSISVAGLQQAISACALSWLPEEYSGSFVDGQFQLNKEQ